MPELTALELADAPERWQALGFTVSSAVCELGGVRLRLGGPGEGMTSWAIQGVDVGQIDGLATGSAPPGARAAHPNGATGLDHVVIASPDFERTATALEHAGLPLKRIRDAGSFRQGFRRIGPAILELVEAKSAPEGPARFWGLVVIVEDLDRLAERLGEHLGRIKPAVQPGRRIATLKSSAGLGEAVAFMDPEP